MSLMLGVFLLHAPWVAGQSPSGIGACTQIADDQARLKCFDREAAKTQAPESGAPGPAVPSAPPAKELTGEQRMGLTPGKILKLENHAEGDLKELNAKIQAVSTSASGHEVFTLDNGQVWRQVELDPRFSVRPGDTVLITRGVLGSYFMSANAHMTTRVSRTR